MATRTYHVTIPVGTSLESNSENAYVHELDTGIQLKEGEYAVSASIPFGSYGIYNQTNSTVGLNGGISVGIKHESDI